MAGTHGRGSSDAEHIWRVQVFPQPPNQHGHIRALSASIGVEFVQHQKIQPLAVLYDRTVAFGVVSGQDQLQHHKVGQQDIRGAVGNPEPLLIVLLAGIALKGKSLGHHAQVFFELLHLTVRKGVHRINDDSAGFAPDSSGPVFQNSIDNGDEKRQRFPGPRSGGDNEAPSFTGGVNRLDLMLIKHQRTAAPALIIAAKDPSAVRMQRAPGDHPLDGLRVFVVRIELQHRLRPITSPLVLLVDGLSDVRRGYF